MHLRPLCLAGVASLALACLSPVQLRGQSRPAGEGRVLRIAYFVPTDRQELPDYVERVDRAISEVQAFYRKGMQENGYGPLTFSLDQDAQGLLRVHVVKAKGRMRSYGRNDSGKVHDEVKEALRGEGIDLDRETVVIFELLLEWKGDKATEVGPYVGGGGLESGAAWVYDDSLLDPRSLASKKPGGYYGGPCSIGEFNSHYIGGIAHELGHALGLPHDQERAVDRERRGVSLMGGGNHTYGQDLRNEGKGTFLSPASAMLLARHPLFTGKPAPHGDPPACRILKLEPSFKDGKMTLIGRVQARPPAFGLIAYNDQERIPADYDAIGYTSKLSPEGEFRLEIDELHPGPYQMRLCVCHDDGRTSSFEFNYNVDRNRRPELGPFASFVLLAQAKAAFASRDAQALAGLAKQAADLSPPDAVMTRKLNHLRALLEPSKPVAPQDVPMDQKTANLSQLAIEAATVGWGPVLRDQVLVEGGRDCFLEVGGEFFEHGLYAHAPARHALKLAGKWKSLRTGFGLEEGHAGSVIFVIRGDGREVFRSQTVRDQRLRKAEVDVSGVDLLELIVEDAGDGRSNDWGVWAAPELHR